MTLISVTKKSYYIEYATSGRTITVTSSITSSSSAPRYFMTRRMGQVGNMGALVESPAK
jgi:hypothetical protein